MSRNVHFDYLRLISTIAIIMLHTAAEGWTYYDINSFEWAVCNFYNSMVRWGVPVFVMISGALFLGRDDISITRIYSKYILRMFTAFVFWGGVYYVIFYDNHNIIDNIIGLFRQGKTVRWIYIIENHYHLWFIPMITALYMCIPILKKIVTDKKIETYFLTLSFCFWIFLPWVVNLVHDFGKTNIVSIVDALDNIVSQMSINIVIGYAFYFVLGYYLSRKTYSHKGRLTIYILGLLGFAFTTIMDWIVVIKTQTPTQPYYSNNSINVCFEAIAVFELFKNITNKNIKLHKFISLMSKWSFGAYIVHAGVLTAISAIFNLNVHFLTPILSIPIVVIVTFVCSFIISALLNQIPILKKYIV